MIAATLLPLSRPLYVHGAPNWVDLHTVDAPKAMVFYRELFGWTFQKRFSLSPVPGAEVEDDASVHLTHIAGKEGSMMAEIVERRSHFDDMSLPSHWASYVNVVDLYATLRRVEAGGGHVVEAPKNRGSLALTATVADPSDALISLWQPVDMAGIGMLGGPGTLNWIELETDDIDEACSFYHKVFGWTSSVTPLVNRYYDYHEDARGDYTVFSTPMGKVAGAVKPIVSGVRASWCPAFSVLDVDVATLRAVRLGAVVMAEPYDIPKGRQSVVLDPSGAAFALLGPKTLTRRL